jgi:hypothetical protein
MSAAILTIASAASASASLVHRHKVAFDHRQATIGEAVSTRPDLTDSEHIHINFRCAKFKGELSWATVEPTHPAYIEITHGELRDPCTVGYARLYIHWDTIDNPKTRRVAHVNAGHAIRTPFYTDDYLNNYKDIYVYVCALVRPHDYHCSRHYGPGA